MKGLLLKDLLILKQQMGFYGLMLVVWAAMSVVNRSPLFFGATMGMLCCLIPMTAQAYDEKVNWEKYAAATPLTRNTLVLSKYILCLIFCLVPAPITLLLYQFVGEGFQSGLLFVPAIFGASLIIASVYLPLIMKFGVEKGRTSIFLASILPAIAIVIFIQVGGGAPSSDAPALLLRFVPIIAVVIFALSALLSIRIMGKKEL